MMLMDIPYLVKLSVTCSTDKASRPIPVKIGINDNLTITKIHGLTTVNFEFMARQHAFFSLEMIDKQDQEAVVIEKIGFFGISDPRFAWAGVYEPKYPEPWASEQRSQGIVLQPQLKSHTYLSWNGKWTLTFDVPVFTWMHHTQNLGWIYS